MSSFAPSSSNPLLVALSLLLAGGLVTACSGGDEGNIAGRGSSIVGGTQDNGDPSVVGIVAFRDEHNGDSCTGTVIAPTIILTAAHCVSPPDYTPVQTLVFPTPTISGATRASALAIKESHVHPLYVPLGRNTYDVAVIVLAQPTSLTPIPYNHSMFDAPVGTMARAVGYGRTVDGVESSGGTKYQAQVPISGSDPTTITAGTATTTQCHGDSGGPLFLDLGAGETIVGITWRTVNDDGTCSGGNINTRVDSVTSFIDQYVNASNQPTIEMPTFPAFPTFPNF